MRILSERLHCYFLALWVWKKVIVKGKNLQNDLFWFFLFFLIRWPRSTNKQFEMVKSDWWFSNLSPGIRIRPHIFCENSGTALYEDFATLTSSFSCTWYVCRCTTCLSWPTGAPTTGSESSLRTWRTRRSSHISLTSSKHVSPTFTEEQKLILPVICKKKFEI